MSEPTPIINRGPSKLEIVEEQIESLKNELITSYQNASEWQKEHIRLEIKKLTEKRNKLIAEKDAKDFDKNKQQISPEMAQALAAHQGVQGMN